MISHSLQMAVAVAAVVTVASWAIGQDPTPKPTLSTIESTAGEAVKAAVEVDEELLRLEQQVLVEERRLAVEQRRLELEERRLRMQQKQKTLDEMKRDLERRKHKDVDPKRRIGRKEQEQKIAAQRAKERAAKLAARKKEREHQAQAEPEIKIFRLLNDKASDQLQIVRGIAPGAIAIAHERTNSLIVVGPEAQLRKVEALLMKLDEMETVTLDPQVQLPSPSRSD